MLSRRLCSSIGWKFAKYYDAYLLWLLMPSTCQWLLIWNSQRKIDGNLIHRLKPVSKRMHHFKEIFEKLSTLMYVKLWSIWCGFYMTSANMFAIGFLWPLFHLWLWILIMAVCRDVDRESFFLLLRWTAFVFIQHFHRITHVSCFQLTDVDVLWTREFNAQHGFLTI